MSPKFLQQSWSMHFKKLNWTNREMSIEAKQLNNLWFADDFLLITGILEQEAKQVGQQINKDKT